MTKDILFLEDQTEKKTVEKKVCKKKKGKSLSLASNDLRTAVHARRESIRRTYGRRKIKKELPLLHGLGKTG